MVNKEIKIKIDEQNYRKNLLSKHPVLKSGRKKYTDYYLRCLKNILLTKLFKFNKGKVNKMLLNKLKFYRKKNYLYVEKK